MAALSRSVVRFITLAGWAIGVGAVCLAASSSSAHTLTVLRVTPGKLVAGDTATIAARFDFDARAKECMVVLDFGDGTPTQDVTVAATDLGGGAALSVPHVYAGGAYMVSVVPGTGKSLPACGGGKHSTLIDVQEAGAAPAEPASK